MVVNSKMRRDILKNKYYFLQIMADIKKLSKNYTVIISRSDLTKHRLISTNSNGIGDRWQNKKYNYSVIYTNRKTKTYSENPDDSIPSKVLDDFFFNNKIKQYKIIGIYVHGERQSEPIKRPIKQSIKNVILKQNRCVFCHRSNELIVDHKNDFYNDANVLESKLQSINDFQCVCNSCNLFKRQIRINEKNNNKLHSAKDVMSQTLLYLFDFEFPWEKKAYDDSDVSNKVDTYLYDPIEFVRKAELYKIYILPIVKSIKKKYGL